MIPEMQAELKSIASRLRELFPGGMVCLSTSQYETMDTPSISIQYHGTKTYQEAMQWFRFLGVKDKQKHPFDTYTQLSGNADGIDFTTYPDELPPTCRVEKWVEKIPLTKTVQVDGFIEVERTRLVCGNPEEAA